MLLKAKELLGDIKVNPVITGSGGLTLANHLNVPFNQEVVSVASALEYYAPKQMWLLNLVAKMLKLYILQMELTNV